VENIDWLNGWPGTKADLEFFLKKFIRENCIYIYIHNKVPNKILLIILFKNIAQVKEHICH
jgi:hypothetical protein